MHFRSFPRVAAQLLLRPRTGRSCLATMRSHSSKHVAYPRAAVAVTTVSLPTTLPRIPHFLLVQRANPPDQGKWSLPGGKINLGEPTLDAARRELTQETTLSAESCEWLPRPFLTTDAIFHTDDSVAFHYVISQCFARAPAGLPVVVPCDDALGTRWYTLSELEAMPSDELSSGIIEVIRRAEELHEKDALL